MEENKKQETVTETAPMPAANQSEQPTVESPVASYVEENVSAVDAEPQKIAKMETARSESPSTLPLRASLRRRKASAPR